MKDDEENRIMFIITSSIYIGIIKKIDEWIYMNYNTVDDSTMR